MSLDNNKDSNKPKTEPTKETSEKQKSDAENKGRKPTTTRIY
jgi:hypothetical protein